MSGNQNISFFQGDLYFNNLKKQTKRLLRLRNIEINNINKDQSKINLTHMTRYTYIKVLNVNIILTLISLSAFNTAKFMEQFLQHHSRGTIRIFPAYSVCIPS